MELQNKPESGNMVSQKINNKSKQASFLNLLLIILPLLFLIYRLFKYFKLGPTLFPDSNDYLVYAREILKGSFVSPDAKRTPGYPLFIAFSYLLLGNRPDSVVWLQIITGLISQYFFVYLLRSLRFSSGIIVAVLLLYLLSPLAYIDLNVLTESFTVFLCISLFLLLFKYFESRKIVFLILVLITAEFLVFTRPQFIVFTVLGAVFLLYKKEKLISILLLVVILFSAGAWSLVNLEKNKYFGMTSLVGFNLINHTGYFIEKERILNPRLADIYIQKRNEFESTFQGRQEFTIWDCKDSIMKAEGYNFTDLGRELLRIDIILILKHPGSYISSVSTSVYNSLIWSNNYSPSGYKLRLTSSLMELIFCTGIIFLFIIGGDNIIFILMKLLFLSNFLFSCMMERGENFRYDIPLLFILFIYFAPGVYLIFKKNLRVNEIFH